MGGSMGGLMDRLDRGIGDFGLGVECCGLVGWNWRLGLAVWISS